MLAETKSSRRKIHWDSIYQTKDTKSVGWYQEIPQESLDFIEQTGLPNTSAIIDIGGGESHLTSNLLERGYRDLTVLDISERALENSQKSTGAVGDSVQWTAQDITEFEPLREYDIWHDRAVFHFLRTVESISQYKSALHEGLRSGGYFIIGTFSLEGPESCSGLKVKQYSVESLKEQFKSQFDLIDHKQFDHFTPSGKPQNYIFCLFKKR